MLSPEPPYGAPPTLTVNSVRQAAASTAIGAALLLYFGFVHLSRPAGNDLFHLAWLGVFYTLRIGGLVSAAIALWLWVGHRPALMADALVALLLGAVLVICAIAMLVNGGDFFQSAIILVCGGTFVSSGLRSGRSYRAAISLGPQSLEKPSDSDAGSARSIRVPDPPSPVNKNENPALTMEKPPEGFLAQYAKKPPP